VRRQAEAADEAVRLLREENQNAPSGEPAGEGDPQASAAPTPATSPSPQDGVAGPAPSHTSDSASDGGWEQRYRSLRGKYDSEVPALQNVLREMRRTVGELQARLTVAPPAPPPPASYTKVAVPDEDVEAYGEELIDRARAWARAELMPEIEQLRHDVVRANGTAQNVATQTAMQGVYAFMDQNLPSWANINTDQRFINWLRDPDPLSGVVRQDMLTAAFTNGDARRTLSFFRAFQNEHTGDYPPGPGASHTPATGSAGQVRLEDMAGPGRGSPGTSGAPASKRFFTQKDIADFYSAVTKGRYHGRETERDRVERELHDAVAEGRVRT
jgi:hypothetical protein